MTPGAWDEPLDKLMSEQGYTLDIDRKTIYKNGLPVWYKQCEGRGCQSRYLGPDELYDEISTDYIAALQSARAKYVNDVADKLGIKVEAESDVVK